MTSIMLSGVASRLPRALRALSAVSVVALVGCASQVGPDPAPSGSESRTGEPGSIALGGALGGSASGVADRAGNLQTNCASGQIGHIRRITDVEYVDSVRSALKVTLGADAVISSRGGTEPFTEAVAVEYATAAENVAKQAVVPASMRTLLGSEAATPATDAQLASFFNTSVSRLWQRSVTSREAAVLQSIYRGASTVGEDGPSHAFDLLLQAVLQAPSFVFRAECD